jgi:hypothetical protein
LKEKREEDQGKLRHRSLLDGRRANYLPFTAKDAKGRRDQQGQKHPVGVYSTGCESEHWR